MFICTVLSSSRIYFLFYLLFKGIRICLRLGGLKSWAHTKKMALAHPKSLNKTSICLHTQKLNFCIAQVPMCPALVINEFHFKLTEVLKYIDIVYSFLLNEMRIKNSARQIGQLCQDFSNNPRNPASLDSKQTSTNLISLSKFSNFIQILWTVLRNTSNSVTLFEGPRV